MTETMTRSPEGLGTGVPRRRMSQTSSCVTARSASDDASSA
jgi:hypothetical protein